MVYLVYSAVTATDLRDNLGRAEYSYFFVREIFRRMLEKHARVVVVTDPVREVDALVEDCARQGMHCVFLSFAPPHRTLAGLGSPTIPVFAWEFDTLPDEVWGDEPRNDWCAVLARVGCAITHSEYSVAAVRAAMGPDFPVVSIPAPLWDHARTASSGADGLPQGETTFVVDGPTLDSRALPPEAQAGPGAPPRKSLGTRVGVTLGLLALWYREVVADLLPAGLRRGIARAVRAIQVRVMRAASAEPAAPAGQATIRIEADAIVYASVFNPHDGRKNWQDMLTAFCIALADHADATLIFKLVHHDSRSTLAEIAAMLRRFRCFRCRVVVIAGFLDAPSYRRLIARSAYVVNSSLSEGQCLPLMEFMSCGKPAIAPRNTAMEDYIDEEAAFVVDSSLEPCCWPQDTRNVFRAHRYRINWHALSTALHDSYRTARHDPMRYAAMSACAVARLRAHCSEAVALGRLRAFLQAKPNPPERGR
jgi:glycosyltransferase involved in cell wall biosynthesis